MVVSPVGTIWWRKRTSFRVERRPESKQYKVSEVLAIKMQIPQNVLVLIFKNACKLTLFASFCGILSIFGRKLFQVPTRFFGLGCALGI